MIGSGDASLNQWIIVSDYPVYQHQQIYIFYICLVSTMFNVSIYFPDEVQSIITSSSPMVWWTESDSVWSTLCCSVFWSWHVLCWMFWCSDWWLTIIWCDHKPISRSSITHIISSVSSFDIVIKMEQHNSDEEDDVVTKSESDSGSGELLMNVSDWAGRGSWGFQIHVRCIVHPSHTFVGVKGSNYILILIIIRVFKVGGLFIYSFQ